MRLLSFLLLLLSGFVANAQLSPAITCWKINTTGTTGFDGIPTNVQSVQYSDSDVYISTQDIASWTPVGYNWPNNPWTPQAQGFTFKITLYPRKNLSTPVTAPYGHIGIWANGVSLYNPMDTKSYDSLNVWFQNAFHFERNTFDECLGHPNDLHEYHLHVNPVCLYDNTDSLHHSPLIGYAFDGFPIYGAYGYSNAMDSTSAIKRMVSSYQFRNMTVREVLPDSTVLDSTEYGPPVDSTYPLGSYIQDYEFVSGLGDLDEHNGRMCVTPEYPNGTYAYFVTIDSTLQPAYPYILGPTYYGKLAPGNTGPNSGHDTATGPVSVYTSVNNVEQKIELSIYPNPVSTQLNFRISGFDPRPMTGTIYDLTGKEIVTAPVTPGITYTYNPASLPDGVYLLKIYGQGQLYTSKFTVAK